MIDHSNDQLWLKCDECFTSLGPFLARDSYGLKIAWNRAEQQAQEDGWTTNEVSHYCPGCAEKVQ
jgi:hypothetical protein